MQVQQGCISEKEKDSKEFVKYSIPHAYPKTRPLFKYRREVLLMQKIDKIVMLLTDLIQIIFIAIYTRT